MKERPHLLEDELLRALNRFRPAGDRESSLRRKGFGSGGSFKGSFKGPLKGSFKGSV